MKMTKFTFIDVEALWDEHLHEAYREIDPRGAAKQKRNDTHRHRIPCKRVIAAAAFSIEVDEGGAISIAGLKSWTQHEHGDEQEVVANLFAHIREKPEARVVTYSGLAAEVPLLTLAAMEYGLVMPQQLCTGMPVFARPGTWRPHIDLALEIKGQGRDWAHLSELCLRLGLPSALFMGKPDIEQPVSSEQWQALRQRVSMDCVLTAVVALAFWRANGRIRLDQVAMLHNVAEWSLRNIDLADVHIEPLVALRAQTIERMAMERDEAA
jgi:hypothetical protein